VYGYKYNPAGSEPAAISVVGVALVSAYNSYRNVSGAGLEEAEENVHVHVGCASVVPIPPAQANELNVATESELYCAGEEINVDEPSAFDATSFS
jgi:hypothetical protein